MAPADLLHDGAVARFSGSLPLVAKQEPREGVRRPIESRWLEVFGLAIHARVGGEGPPVVLVHGYGVSGSYMLPLAQSLAPSYSVFAPDLPGYGRSQRPHIPLGIADLAAALAGWLDAAGLRCPAFVANSMGCQIVTELAVRLPRRVGPMVLIGPTVDPQRRAARHQLLGGLRDAAREPRSLLALDRTRRLRFRRRRAPGDRSVGARRPDRAALTADHAADCCRARRGRRVCRAELGRDGRGPVTAQSARRCSP